MRTVEPARATSAKEPDIDRTASASPAATRARASSSAMLRTRLADGSVRSMRRWTYWLDTFNPSSWSQRDAIAAWSEPGKGGG